MASFTSTPCANMVDTNNCARSAYIICDGCELVAVGLRVAMISGVACKRLNDELTDAVVLLQRVPEGTLVLPPH